MSFVQSRHTRSLLALLAVLTAPASLRAHPHFGLPTVGHTHEALGLEVFIADDGVRFDVLLSNGYFNLLIPRERGRLKLVRKGEAYAFLDPEQEEAERSGFETLFIDYAPDVIIDGVPVPCAFERFELLASVDPTGVIDHSLAPPDARVVLRAAAPVPPQRVELTWSLYPVGQNRDAFGEVRPAELAAKLDAYAQERIVTLTPDASTLVWEKPNKVDATPVAPVSVDQIPSPLVSVPLLSCALIAGWLVVLAGLRLARAPLRLRRAALVLSVVPVVGAYYGRGIAVAPVGSGSSVAGAMMTDAQAKSTFEALLSNVYRAFDYKSESDIYDVLARSVDGTQLESIYDEVYDSLVAREQGGAVSRVKDIDFITVQLDDASAAPSGEVRLADAGSFAVRCRWRVNGIVYHWGHMHRRTNEYKARYTVSRRGDAWKITGCEVLGQRRLAGPSSGDGSAGANAVPIGSDQP